MARLERSAGIILFYSPPAGGRRYLLLDYGRHWDYPKGHLEPGEDDLSAALRELREETGIEDAHLVPGFTRQIEYYFRTRQHGLIHKHVTFFAARTQTTDIQLSREHVGYAFLPFAEARTRLTYPSARTLLDDLDRFLHENPTS